MGYYLDIVILPNQELNVSSIMNSVFSKFHLALVRLGHGKIGVSFPKAEKSLGNIMRLHGDKPALEELMATSWLQRFSDYATTTSIKEVPSQCKYRIIRRVQAKSNLERLYRRSIKNERITPEEALKKINEKKEATLKLPYLQLTSSSTKQPFRLFVRQEDLRDSPKDGCFSSYALSDSKNEATIPWF